MIIISFASIKRDIFLIGGEKMETISARIKRLCKARGITIVKFETDCGLSHGYLRTLERQKSMPSIERVAKIADYFKVSKEYILGEEEPQTGVGVLIPLLGRVAAGVPISAVENIIGQEEITAQLAKTGEFFALRIKGNSMSPFIMDGDVVVVKQQNDAENGDIVIALVDGDDGVCKRFKRTDGGIMLISLNSDYEPLIFTHAEIDSTPVEILGKVIEIRRAL